MLTDEELWLKFYLVHLGRGVEDWAAVGLANCALAEHRERWPPEGTAGEQLELALHLTRADTPEAQSYDEGYAVGYDGGYAAGRNDGYADGAGWAREHKVSND